MKENSAFFLSILIILATTLVLTGPIFLQRTSVGKAIGTLVFDTGIGNLLTGSDHYSQVIFKPATTIQISSIKPEIASCHGTCHYEVNISAMNGSLLAHDLVSDTDPDKIIAEFTKITLTAGTEYNITQHIWSAGADSSVSVYATGVNE